MVTLTTVHMAGTRINNSGILGEEDAPEEVPGGDQVENEPDSEDAAPKGGVRNCQLIIILINK